MGGGKNRSFEIDGIRLAIPADCLTAPLAEALASGRYEHSEAEALRRHLVAADRVLELGAGAGFLSAVAARTVGADNVIAVEANPRMMDALRANLAANGAAAVTVIHGAAVAGDHAAGTVPFLARRAFWAAELAKGAKGDPARVADVPAISLAMLLRDHRPSVVVMDIEGAEVDLVSGEWPGSVRLLLMELHVKKYGGQGVRAIFDALSAAGFAYMPWGSRAETLVFERLP